MLKLGKRYDVSGMLELLAEIEGKSKIVVSGHPDAAAQLYSPRHQDRGISIDNHRPKDINGH